MLQGIFFENTPTPPLYILVKIYSIMARSVYDIYTGLLQQWYDEHKNYDNALSCPYLWLETNLRFELKCKKKTAFNWIVELSDLNKFHFDGARIEFELSKK